MLEPSLALAIYGFCSLLVTYPLVWNLGRRFLGAERSDLWFHVWGYWWMKESLLVHHRFPVQTDHVNFPNGGILFNIDPLGSLLSVPLQVLFGLPAAYNLVALGSMVFAAMAAHYLVRFLLRRSGTDTGPVCLPALVAGVVFGFSPHLLGEMENGITETFHVGLCALYALLLLRTFQRRTPGAGVAMGLALFVTFFANTYYGLFCVLLSMLVLVHQLLVRRRHVLSRRFALALGVSVICFGALAGPYYAAFSAAHDAPESLVRRNPEPRELDHLVRNKAFITEATSLFRPHVHDADHSRREGDHFTNINYLGYLTLALALLGAALARTGRQRHLWTAAALVFAVLSLGPVPVVNGQILGASEETYVTLPFYWLFARWPYLSLVSHPYRVTVMTMLALAVLAGLGADRLLRWLPAWPLRAGVAALLMAGVLAETVLVSPVIQPMSQKDASVPRFYRELGVAGGRGAVINVPMAFCGTNQRRIYYYFQTAHRRRLPFVIEKTITPYLMNNGLTAHVYFLEWLADKHTLRPYYGYKQAPADLAARAAAGRRDLKKKGFRYVVLDRQFLLPSQRRAFAPIKQYLDRHLGEAKPYGEAFLVYTIP